MTWTTSVMESQIFDVMSQAPSSKHPGPPPRNRQFQNGGAFPFLSLWAAELWSQHVVRAVDAVDKK